MPTYSKYPMDDSVLYPLDIAQGASMFFFDANKTYEPWIYVNNNSTANCVIEIECGNAAASTNALNPRFTCPPGTTLIWAGIAVKNLGYMMFTFISQTGSAPDTGKFTLYGHMNVITP